MSLKDIKKGDVLLRNDVPRLTVELRLDDLVFLTMEEDNCKIAVPICTWQELERKEFKIKKSDSKGLYPMRTNFVTSNTEVLINGEWKVVIMQPTNKEEPLKLELGKVYFSPTCYNQHRLLLLEHNIYYYFINLFDLKNISFSYDYIIYKIKDLQLSPDQRPYRI